MNEFVAYLDLGVLIKNKETFLNHTLNYNRTWEYTGDLDIVLHALPPTFLAPEILSFGYISVSPVSWFCNGLDTVANS